MRGHLTEENDRIRGFKGSIFRRDLNPEQSLVTRQPLAFHKLVDQEAEEGYPKLTNEADLLKHPLYFNHAPSDLSDFNTLTA